ncbi:MAG: GFA family protein [Rhodobacteraceae bacterium]|nr:GFA family protein [Paracoccaceae bacterium]
MEQITGQCLYSTVQVTVPPMSHDFEACHRVLCRAVISGGPFFGMAARVFDGQFTGDADIAIYRSSESAKRGFCGICGAVLWHKITAPGPMHGQVQVAAGLFPDPGDAKPGVDLYIGKKPVGYSLAGERGQMTEAEVIAAFALSESGGSE